jgi:hypothetical protein
VERASVDVTAEHVQKVRRSNCVIHRERSGEAAQKWAVKGVCGKPEKQQRNANCA